MIDHTYRPQDITNSGNRTIRLLFVTTLPVTLRHFLIPFSSHFCAQGWVVDGMAKGVSECVECVKAFDHVWDVAWSAIPWIRGTC